MRLTDVPNHPPTRTSEDDLEQPINVTNQLEDLGAEIDWLELDFMKTDNWRNTIETQVARIDTRIKSFLCRVSLVGEGINIDAIEKAMTLRTRLLNLQTTLLEKAAENASPNNRQTLLPARLTWDSEGSRRTNTASTSSQEQNTIIFGNDEVFPRDTDIFSTRDNNSSVEQLSRRIEHLERNHRLISNVHEKINKISTTVQTLVNNQQVVESRVDSVESQLQHVTTKQLQLTDDLKSVENRVQSISTDITTKHESITKDINTISTTFKLIKENVRENKKHIKEITLNNSTQPRTTNNSTTARSMMSKEGIGILEDSIQDLTERINHIINQNVSSSTSESTVAALVKREIPLLDKYVTQCCDKLMKYTESELTNASFVKKSKKHIKGGEHVGPRAKQTIYGTRDA